MSTRPLLPRLISLVAAVALAACDRPTPPAAFVTIATDTVESAASDRVSPPPEAATDDPRLDLSALELREALVQGELTSLELVDGYLARIARLDAVPGGLKAVIELDPSARAQARARDAERAGLDLAALGALHGVPVLLKANIDTGDAMATSAGSLLLADHHAPDDAFLVRRLRAAGAVILGKTNLSEWANFRSSESVSGWSSAGGQTRNPHVLDRNPCGSSSGSAVAVAAGLAPLAVGTETNGSVVCPASVNGIVGIKPTLGLVSRDGIIPIAASFDTAGAMARTVRDAALLLQVMRGVDRGDLATVEYGGWPGALIPDANGTRLDGVRIGVLRDYFGAGRVASVERVFDASLTALRALGAELVDPLELGLARRVWQDAFTVMKAEFRDGLDRYLIEAGVPEDRNTLEKIVALNAARADETMPIFGQDVLVESLAAPPVGSAAHREAVAHSQGAVRARLEDAFTSGALAAIVAPTDDPAWKIDHVLGDQAPGVSSSGFAAISGHPNVTVPAGFDGALPLGVSFIGKRGDDAALIRIAHAFEQATRARRAPAFLPSLDPPPGRADSLTRSIGAIAGIASLES